MFRTRISQIFHLVIPIVIGQGEVPPSLRCNRIHKHSNIIQEND